MKGSGKMGPTVAIDGPAGSGKSSVSKLLADRLGFTHINTGALYRGVALLALREKVDLTNEIDVLRCALGKRFEFQKTAAGNSLYIDQEDVSVEIRAENVGKAASVVSAFPGVRNLLLQLQRDLGKNGAVVLEGRDIGTVVFPNAEVKIFLTASLEERAQRRAQELKAKNQPVDLAEIQEEIAQRDKRDSTREIAPLKQAEDAILFDTTGKSIDSVLSGLESIVKKRSFN